MIKIIRLCTFNFSQKADVDAGALSRYVVALLKKNNSSEELKEMCVDHIDCFFVESKVLVIFSLLKLS